MKLSNLDGRKIESFFAILYSHIYTSMDRLLVSFKISLIWCLKLTQVTRLVYTFMDRLLVSYKMGLWCCLIFTLVKWIYMLGVLNNLRQEFLLDKALEKAVLFFTVADDHQIKSIFKFSFSIQHFLRYKILCCSLLSLLWIRTFFYIYYMVTSSLHLIWQMNAWYFQI